MDNVAEEKKIEIAQWLLDPDQKKHPIVALSELEEKIKKEGLEKVYREIELPLIPILEDMQRTGIKIDLPYLQKLSKEFEKEIQRLEKEIYEKAGMAFNLNSPQQLSEVLFQKLKIESGKLRKTKTGLISTDEETLSLIKDKRPVVELILKYRELFKLQSTYVLPLQELADEKGRIHTTFLQTGAATGRLSSRNPNMQNIPILGDWAEKIRRAFISERGFTLLEFDYSQIELRVLASVTKDEALIRAFKEGSDIHATTAAYVYGIPVEKITKDMRRVAKTLNFGISYGMGANAFAKVSGLRLSAARATIKRYFDQFPAIRRWQEETLEKAKIYGYVETLNGRKRFLSFINSPNPRLQSEAERMATNAPIQGAEADIMKMAMIRIAQELKGSDWWQTKARLLLTIHDALLFEVQDDMREEAAKRLKAILENIYPLDVPITVGIGRGKNWAEVKR